MEFLIIQDVKIALHIFVVCSTVKSVIRVSDILFLSTLFFT